MVIHSYFPGQYTPSGPYACEEFPCLHRKEARSPPLHSYPFFIFSFISSVSSLSSLPASSNGISSLFLNTDSLPILPGFYLPFLPPPASSQASGEEAPELGSRLGTGLVFFSPSSTTLRLPL